MKCDLYGRNTGVMPSTTTQAIAARVPNRIAERLRERAERDGLTMSDVVKAAITRGLKCDAPASIEETPPR